ncbi:DUF3841 domain-containing protein [Niveispirillum sp. BGYR6]|uniref:DUF3841 domain-containing protein n=1 Tax=Niveispirillum sp. BGYR6 TaxID=2971249 RepID=UPI0022B9AD81|nr:DUF3841 domain-containing protein [Niveispirillum sp. BGYR6]MDG5497723.1 DUF3841 domain-containing protein [Niveispirillum sp. BGYR6]
MVRPVNINRVKAIIAKRVPFVRVYSYQDEAVLERLKTQGFINGNHPHGFMTGPYRWMRNQMAERLPDFSGDLPIWAWLRRWDRYKIKRNTEKLVRITATVPVQRVLLSNFDSWHIVLNLGYMAETEAEDDAFDAAQHAPADKIRLCQESWKRVFDPDLRYCDSRSWQVCVDRIYAHEVVDLRQHDPLPHRYRPVTEDCEPWDGDWCAGWFPPPP